LNQPGKERDFILGTTRPWVIGFFDTEFGDTVWSPYMDFVLDSGAPTKPVVKKKGIATVKDGVHVTKYNYVGIDPRKKCKHGTRCDGWSVTGTYKVKTPEKNKSYIELEVVVKPPKGFKFNLRHRFGVSWSVEYAKDKTESFIAYYNPKKKEYLYRNWKRGLSISRAHKNAL